MKENSHIRYGIYTMLAWCLFVVVIFGTYLFFTHQSIDYFIDDETNGIGFACFFVLWAFIWYKIGSHYRLVYLAKKEEYKRLFPNISELDLAECLRKECLTKSSKLLAIVFGTAVPWYVIANVRDEVTTKNAVYIGILMILSVVFALYYKHNRTSKI